MNNILVIAPYEALVEQAERMNEICDIPYTVIPGNLKENFDEIRSYINQGVKILISRGGTAQALRNSFDLPVIEIPVTSVDILMALSKASEQGFKKIAFITTLNILFQAKHFNNIMDIDLQILPCQDANEIPAKVKHLIEDRGIDAVVGDVVATQQAIERGIYGCLLESGPMSLQIALNEAATILKSMEKEKARLKQLEAILNFTTEAVLTIDDNEKVTVYNASAERIFGVPINQVLGNKLTECLPESLLNKVLSENNEEKNILLKISGKKIVCNRVPIIIHGRFHGAVAIFQEIGEIQNLEMNIRTRLNEKGLVAKKSFNDIQGGSPEMLKCIQQARQYAKSNGTVLIYGETGTGKELFAQSIHNESKRAKGPFVSVNCAALSENLLESELFGYVEGTFTGALKGGKMGLFELAHGGTLFLDELGEISLNFQAKLLRVLQEKEVRRVGGDRVTPIDVRIICATNRDLREEVRLGRFREDLYYRLSVLELQLMPLRLRKDDIVPMAINFFKSECIREEKVLFLPLDQLFDCLKSYDWFGNARELQNFIERLVISTEEGEELTEYKICELLAEKKGKLYDRVGQNQEELQVTISNRFEDMENQLWKQLLERYHGNKDRLCKDFGISKTTLWRKLNFHK